MSRFLAAKRTVLTAAVVGAMALSGCSDDDGDGNGGGGGDPTVIGSGGSRLVGDWIFAADGNMNNHRYFLTFEPNGNLCWSEFRKVDNFWVGGEICEDTFRADNQYIYNYHERYGERRMEFTLVGNTLTVSACEWVDWNDNEYCWEEVYTKGGGRPSGTIRSGDPVLNGTEWRMSFDGYNTYLDYLDFYGRGAYLYVSNSAGYFSDYHYDYVWYTNGNRLFMLGLSEVPGSCRMIYDRWDDEYYEGDCAMTVAEQVEFTYTRVPRVSLTLTNQSLGINDVWSYSEENYDYSSSLSKRRNAHNKRQPTFRPQPRRMLSKR